MSSLAVTSSGAGPRLVALHGFTQDASHWAPLAPWMGAGRELCCVDLPGHGRSSEVSMDLDGAAAAVLELAADGPVDLLGYSLGARTALVAALSNPGAVRRLVLISGTAGIEDDAERAARRSADEALAKSLEADGDVTGFLRRWLAQPMFGRLGAAANLEARLTNTARGLAASLRTMGTGAMLPRWSELAQLDVPTLVVAGAADAKFSLLGRRLTAALPTAAFSLVPGTAHACHLEAPDRVGPLVARWLDGLVGAEPS
jgi:2-succinyl-6-hydroxy-2,4-cyclohexadiene-1-carboxylate synthase